jgi:Spy/CpxP family protein refolding chaperone
MIANRKSMAGIAVAFCITALTAFAGIAQADGRGCGGEQAGKHRQHDFRKIADKLGLSDTQKAQAKKIFQDNRDAVKPIFSTLRTEQENLHKLIHADVVDEAAIRTETAKIAAIQAELNVDRAKVGAQFRVILTPAQLATLKGLQHKRHGHGKDDPDAPPAEP